MKEIILHIGAGKTGSSSIQKSLDLNKEVLKKEGLIVPTTDLQKGTKSYGQQVWYFAELRTMEIEDAKSKLESDIESIFEEASDDMVAMILTAENLSDDYDWPKLFVDLKSKYKLSILFYIRRQDNYLLSAWQQWYVKSDDDFWAWIIGAAGVLGNWKKVIENWLLVVDKQNFNVRKFERSSLINSDVVSDFYAAIGISLDVIDSKNLSIESNKSFNLAILDFVEKNKNLADNAHDNEFYNFVAKYTKDSFRNKKESKLNHFQRMAILKKYANQNHWIRKNFFGERTPNHLFKPPKEHDYNIVSNDVIDQQKWNTVIELIFNLYKNTKKKPK